MCVYVCVCVHACAGWVCVGVLACVGCEGACPGVLPVLHEAAWPIPSNADQ